MVPPGKRNDPTFIDFMTGEREGLFVASASLRKLMQKPVGLAANVRTVCVQSTSITTGFVCCARMRERGASSRNERSAWCIVMKAEESVMEGGVDGDD